MKHGPQHTLISLILNLLLLSNIALSILYFRLTLSPSMAYLYAGAMLLLTGTLFFLQHTAYQKTIPPRPPKEAPNGQTPTTVPHGEDRTPLVHFQLEEPCWRMLAQHAQEGLFVCQERTGQFCYVNPYFCTMLNNTEEVLLTLRLSDLIDPKHAASSLINSKNTTPPPIIRTQYKTQNGKSISVSVRTQPYTQAGENYTIGIVQPTTLPSRVLRSLEESEELLHVTLNSTADGILVIDAHRNVLVSNRRFAEMWRIPQPILETQDDKQLLKQVLSQVADPEVFLATVEHLYNSQKEALSEIHFKDGRVFEQFSMPFQIQNKHHGRIWSFRDITARVQANEAVQRSEERYRRLFENANDGIIVMKERVCIDCNKKALEMYQCRREQIVGHDSDDFAPEYQPDGVSSHLHVEQNLSLLKQGKPLRFEWQHQRLDKSHFLVEITLTTASLEEGNVVYAIERDITKRKKNEEELRQLRSLLSNIINSMPSTLIGIDTEGRVMQWNRHAERATGITEAQAQGKQGTKLFPFLKPYQDNITAAIQNNTLYQATQVALPNTDKEPKYVDLTVYPLEANGISGAVIRIDDVTTRVQTASALKQSEERYRRLFEAANDAILVLHGETYIDCNAKALEMFHCSYDDIIGRRPDELSPETQPNGQNSHALARKNIHWASQESGFVFEWIHKRFDGTLLNAEVTLNTVNLSDSTIAHAIVRDITKRKQNEEELRQLRSLLSNIINSMPSTLIGVNTEGRVTHWNQHAEKVTGIPAEQATGKPVSQVFPYFQKYMEKIPHIIQTGTSYQDTQVPLLQDKEKHYADITLYPLVSNGIKGAVIRIDDVTERVRLEEIMIQSEKMLSVGGLAAGMAHEINNPLAGILQSMQVIQQRLSPDLPRNQQVAQEFHFKMEDLQSYIQKRSIDSMVQAVLEAGNRAAKIVENMLSFSRKGDMQFHPENIAQLLDQTVELVSNDYDLKKNYDFRSIIIQREYAPNLPKLSCERTKIQQVFLNLLKNGAQAMGEKPSPHKKPLFTLRVLHSGVWIRIEIEDNGPGIPEAVRKRIFEPFFTTKDIGLGTGLGLSVSYFIITENHRGRMWVTPGQKDGACFIIELPLDPKEQSLEKPLKS